MMLARYQRLERYDSAFASVVNNSVASRTNTDAIVASETDLDTSVRLPTHETPVDETSTGKRGGKVGNLQFALPEVASHRGGHPSGRRHIIDLRKPFQVFQILKVPILREYRRISVGCRAFTYRFRCFVYVI
jgi:hypothetical protein